MAKTAILNGPSDLINIPLDSKIRGAGKRVAITQVFIMGFLGMWAGTEFIAWRFHFARALSDQLITTYLYNPWAGIWPWGNLLTTQFADRSLQGTITTTMALGYGIMAVGPLIGYIRGRGLYKHYVLNAPRTHDYEGSAHWATPEEVGKTGLLPPEHHAAKRGFRKVMQEKKSSKKLSDADTRERKTSPRDRGKEWRAEPGVYVGEYIDPRTGKRQWLRDVSNRHIGLFAPTRAGKGVAVIIPTCLTWNGSMVANDPKGELYQLTSWYRKNKLGQLIFKFDPTCMDGTAARINVLDFVRIGTDYEVADAQGLAKMICDPQGHGLDTGKDSDHWKKTAYSFLTGAILHVLYSKEVHDKTLTGLDAFLSNPEKVQKELFVHMMEYEHDPDYARCWHDASYRKTRTCPTVAMAARDMLDRPDSERGSVMSSVKSYFDLYRDPIVAQNISRSDFSIHDLMYGEKPVSLYLQSTPNNMERLRPLMRLIVNVIMTTFTDSVEYEGVKEKPRYKHRLLMVFDEFTSTLSRMDILANSLSFVAGYGIKVLIVVQDMVQLAEKYGDKGAQALVSNLHTLIVYATNNSQTARTFSEQMGRGTLRRETVSYNGGKKSRSESFHGRPLLDQAELQSLPATDAIVLVNNSPPIYCKKIIYYVEESFRSRCGHAVIQSDRIAKADQVFTKLMPEYAAKSKAQVEERRKLMASHAVRLGAEDRAEPTGVANLFGMLESADDDNDYVAI
jgi:type IV secretion system protein VirD4